jgi:hypothetical protein
MALQLPAIVADTQAEGVPLFPRGRGRELLSDALMCAPDRDALDALAAIGVRSTLRIPFKAEGIAGEFLCECRTVCDPSFELHAAAELFAQFFALRLEMDPMKG